MYGSDKINAYKQDFQHRLKWDMYTQKTEEVKLYTLSVKVIENEDIANKLVNRMKDQLHWSVTKQFQE